MVCAHRGPAAPPHCLLPDFSTWARAFFTTTSLRRTARAKFWKDERIPDLLVRLADALEALPEWDTIPAIMPFAP